MAKLSQVLVEGAKPRAVRYELADALLVGLRLTVQPSSAKSWCVRTRVNGRTVKITLGSFPAIGVAKARELGRVALVQAQAGINITDERREARRKAAAADGTLRAIAEEYFKREGGKLRTMGPRLRYFERLILPTIGSRLIGEIRRIEIVRLLDRVQDECGSRAADLCLAYLSRLFNWHAARSDDFRSPLVRGMGRHEAKARERVLTDDELRTVWKAADSAGVFGLLVKFLLLTGARRSEAGNMTWGELDGSTWLLPESRNKTKVPLARPLSGAAQGLLASVPRFEGCPYVFSIGTRPIGSFSKCKAALDEASAVSSYVIHDLRRTSRSLMSRAGVGADVAEMCLGHTLPRIRGTYDRHSYAAEKLHAYESLASLIERIVHPAENVTALRR
jgi:integrase